MNMSEDLPIGTPYGPAVVPKDSTFVATVKYLYFMRFSIMLWLFFPLLVALDWSEALAAMTRGIVAMDSYLHLSFASFFVVVAGWIALLSARIACAYGEERCGCKPPRYFSVGKKMSWWAFLGAQVPGFFLVGYAGHATLVEQGNKPEIGPAGIAGFILLGIVAALACWTLMAGIYYWMFWRQGAAAADTAKAFVVPYAGLFSKIEDDPPSSALLGLLRLFDRAAKLGPGYGDPGRGIFELHSGHAFAFLTLGFLAAIYLAFWDFTAPVELAKVRLLARIIFVVAALLWAFLSLRIRRALKQPDKVRYVVRMLVLFSPLLFVVSLPFGIDNHPFAMPVLGFVTVLVTFVSWGLSGMAFFFDRFRIPVLTSVLVILFAGNLVFGKWAGTDEHYITSFPAPTVHGESQAAQLAALTPGEILCKFEGDDCGKGKSPRPVIIVTATGGGIHAAVWTSSALTAIEEEFVKHVDAKKATFHDSILLMSTVSGGSVGVAPWLSHYLDDSDFKDKEDSKIVGCSDLQAAAWGLVYADFLRVLMPLRFSSLGKTLNTYDRGWALEQAFGRNRKARCDPNQFKDTFANEQETRISAFDLAKYLDPEKHRSMPAFSLNTTAEETGARFLIANYDVVPQKDKSEITPAHSFLFYFQRDLPLSTAARLSANFPYVSPMPRLDKEGPSDNHRNYHFGDGGYFDNDGTASAMEFLWYAFDRLAGQSKIPVLIVEIRDGPDPSGLGDPDPTQKEWSGQALGPLSTFYNANHVSVTRRNRRELCFMEKALDATASFTHIVLPFNPCEKEKQCSSGKQALSWHLTRSQKLQMQTALSNVKDEIEEIGSWYANPTAVPVLDAGESSYHVGDRIDRKEAKKVNADLKKKNKKLMEYEPGAADETGCYKWVVPKKEPKSVAESR
jgi:hypothetical protein